MVYKVEFLIAARRKFPAKRRLNRHAIYRNGIAYTVHSVNLLSHREERTNVQD